MVFKFARTKLLNWQEISNLFFGWLILEMIKLDDYRAISQTFHELAKLIFFFVERYKFPTPKTRGGKN